MLRAKYNARRDNAIDISNRYIDWKSKNPINDGVDINILQTRINTLKEKKFVLAIAGEVKAGKSTFINALLGDELLPSGALQATSAIVEIFKSDKSFLKIKYVSGREEEIYDDLTTEHIDEAKEKLKMLCSISDEYREIPTTLINEYIKNSDSKLEVTDDFIKELEQRSSLKSLDQHKDKIQKYLKEVTKDNIPLEIQFGYPLEWHFSELRLVDTPGVNASGGFEDVTFKFINNADAIIFVKPIKPVESKSFQIFVNNNITDKSREMVFLVLTHTGDELAVKDTLLNETKRFYKDIISEEKIISIDSIFKQIHTDIIKGKTIDEIKKESPVKKSKIPLIRELAEEDNISFEQACLKYSGFDEFKQVIDRFSEEAPNLQILSILDKIKNGYDNQLNQYDEKIKRLQQKVKDPQAYEIEIQRIQEALKELEYDFNSSIQEFKKVFKGRDTLIIKKIEDFHNNKTEKIDKCEDTNQLRKTFADIMNDSNNIINEAYNELENYANSILKKLSKEYKSKHNITIPQVDLDKVEKDARTKATIIVKKVESIWDNWNWLKFNWSKESRTTYTDKLDESKLIKEMQIVIKKELINNKENILLQLVNAVDDFLKVLEMEFFSSIDERKKHLDEERRKKQANDEILKEIKEIEQKKTILELETKKITELQEDMR